MVQAIGALLVLIGAVMWHIAHSGKPLNGISDVWGEFLLAATGKK